MNIPEGLTAISTGLTVVKQLREIDKSVDEAAFKLKLADLQSALADAKIALAEAREEQLQNRSEISSLKEELASARNGDICPKCRSGRLVLDTVRPKTQYGLQHFGVEEWEMLCDADQCDFRQKRVHDPHGAVKEAVKRQAR